MNKNILFPILFLLSALRRSETLSSTNMSCLTFAQIRSLSLESPDPPRASWAMHALLCNNLKLTRRVLTKNLLTKLMHLNIGTNEVEKYAKVVCHQNVRKGRNNKLIREAMKHKVEDAK